MRLTLRTLLAWLDDTLPSHEVRQIGKQVAESPFAQELVDRTYRVTRQRRLLVPPTLGPDATDPNIVSAYLDNELPPELVAEYEKRCLTSDVNLAEVASVHQILSLIGQKAKVPSDAKARMYRLVKGRESAYAQDAVRRAGGPAPAAEPAAPTASAPRRPSPWSPPSMPGRPLVERVGIGALVLGLLALVGWTAYSVLSPEADSAPTRLAQDEPAPPPPAPIVVQPAPPVEPAPPPESPRVAEATPAPDAAAAKGAEAKPAPPSAAKLTTPQALLLAWDPAKADWSRVVEASPIRPGARLANLAPFWSTVQADAAKLTLIDESEATFHGGKGQALKLDFDRGRAILAGGAEGSPHVVTFAGKACTVACSPGAVVGLQRIWGVTPGVAKAEAPPVTIFVDGGEASFQFGDAPRKTLKGPAIATWAPAGAIEVSNRSAMPPWMTESGPPPSARELGGRFLKDFSANGPVLRDLVQAVDGEDPDVRRLAIHALGAIGEAEMVVPVLNNAMTDPATRRAAADVLRGMLARGGDAAKSVREELSKVFGEMLAEPTEKLLVGFTPEEGAKESTHAELVKMLTTPELGTRELALQALMALTGRDNMEYDPTRPEGGGLKTWEDLVKKEASKARPAAPR
jgi:hypothetical protein